MLGRLSFQTFEKVNSPKSFMSRTKDIYDINCLEKTETFCLKVNDLGYLFDSFPEIERYARLSMGSVFGYLSTEFLVS